MPAYHGGPRIVHWNGNLTRATQLADEDLDHSDVHDQHENDASDEVEPDTGSQIEVCDEGRFLQMVFNGVTTQRALRRKRNELRKCCQDVRDADFMVKQYQLVMDARNPATDEEWNMHNAIFELVTEWEAKLSEHQNLEQQINLEIEFLEYRAEEGIYHDGDFQQLTRDSNILQFWSGNNDFWGSFDKCQETSESLVSIGRELEQSNKDKDGFDAAMDRELRRDLDFTVDNDGSFSVLGEEIAYRDMSRIPDLIQKRKELQENERATRKLQTDLWMHMLRLSEDAFVKAEVLDLIEEEDGEEQPEPQVPEPEDAQPEATQTSESEAKKKDLRENLRIAVEACRKARDDFDDARKFSQEEIEQLPQPVTEDNLGFAKALKLARLTHALHTAEEEYSDAKGAARDAGIAKPQEQTANFSDQSGDGYDTAVIERAVVQASERVSRVQGWTGLHLEPQEMTEEVQMDLPKTIEDLVSVRLGEDSFDMTEARGRTRDRIDAMAMESETLRDAGDFPKADADPLGFDFGEP
jgi:hypothetical protein